MILPELFFDCKNSSLTSLENTADEFILPMMRIIMSSATIKSSIIMIFYFTVLPGFPCFLFIHLIISYQITEKKPITILMDN